VTLLIFLQICNMLKKKHEEAKEIMVRAIVTNNSLLMLNHPMFDEKISFFFLSYWYHFCFLGFDFITKRKFCIPLQLKTCAWLRNLLHNWCWNSFKWNGQISWRYTSLYLPLLDVHLVVRLCDWQFNMLRLFQGQHILFPAAVWTMFNISQLQSTSIRKHSKYPNCDRCSASRFNGLDHPRL
jgi:hypothetical protein